MDKFSQEKQKMWKRLKEGIPEANPMDKWIRNTATEIAKAIDAEILSKIKRMAKEKD